MNIPVQMSLVTWDPKVDIMFLPPLLSTLHFDSGSLTTPGVYHVG